VFSVAKLLFRLSIGMNTCKAYCNIVVELKVTAFYLFQIDFQCRKIYIYVNYYLELCKIFEKDLENIMKSSQKNNVLCHEVCKIFEKDLENIMKSSQKNNVLCHELCKIIKKGKRSYAKFSQKKRAQLSHFFRTQIMT